jgi:hypothetical protein
MRKENLFSIHANVLAGRNICWFSGVALPSGERNAVTGGEEAAKEAKNAVHVARLIQVCFMRGSTFLRLAAEHSSGSPKVSALRRHAIVVCTFRAMRKRNMQKAEANAQKD